MELCHHDARENMDEVGLSSAQDVKAWYAHVRRELKSFSKDNCWFERMCESHSDWSQAKCGLCANPNPKLRLNLKSSRFPLLIFSDIIATAATCKAIKSPLLNCAVDPLTARSSVCKVSRQLHLWFSIRDACLIAPRLRNVNQPNEAEWKYCSAVLRSIHRTRFRSVQFEAVKIYMKYVRTESTIKDSHQKRKRTRLICRYFTFHVRSMTLCTSFMGSHLVFIF